MCGISLRPEEAGAVYVCTSIGVIIEWYVQYVGMTNTVTTIDLSSFTSSSLVGTK